MSEKVREDARGFVKFLQGLSAEDRARGHRVQLEVAEKEYHQFHSAFVVGKCFMCGGDLSAFDSRSPCLHWLLRPVGFTKHYFMSVTRRFDMFQIQSYLRWVANEDGFARNINDLSDEGTGKLVEVTIRHGDCEWAFSCGEGDYMGHDSAAEVSKRPHYHFQMRYKHQAFIRYSDFHVPLSEKDIVTIEARRTAPDFVLQRFPGGEGMSDVLNESTLEDVVHHTVPADSEEEGTFNLQTMILATEGGQISGEQLMELFAEAKSKGVTVASLAPRLSNVNVQTIIQPAAGVVEQAPRSPRKKRP